MVTDLPQLAHTVSPDPSGTNGTPPKGRWLESGSAEPMETTRWSPQELSLHPTTVLVWKELKPANGAARRDPGEHFHFSRN